jgi:hypothetical protein
VGIEAFRAELAVTLIIVIHVSLCPVSFVSRVTRLRTFAKYLQGAVSTAVSVECRKGHAAPA